MKFNKGTAKTVSWQLKLPEGLVERFRLIASVGGVSVDHLIAYILEDWTHKNRSLLMDDSLPTRLKNLMSGESITKQVR